MRRYKNTFTSFLKQEKAAQTSRWKQTVGLDDEEAIQALNETHQAELEKITIAKFLKVQLTAVFVGLLLVPFDVFECVHYDWFDFGVSFVRLELQSK